MTPSHRCHDASISYVLPFPFHTDADADSEETLQDVDEDAEGELAPGKQTMRVVFQPTFGEYHANACYKCLFMGSADLTRTRHHAYNLLPWTLASCAPFQEVRRERD